jgi:hypothetical protein
MEDKSMRNKSMVEVLSQDEIDLLLATINAGESINSEENSMADRGSFERKCSFCGQEEKTLVANNDNRSFICPKCIIECASILVFEKYDPSDTELSELLDDLIGGTDKNRLKILSWNCHYGLNLEKYLGIMTYKPEVLILQECTKNDFEFIKSMWEYGNWYNDAMYSNDQGLGLAILSNKCKINFTETFNRRFRYMIPYELTWNDERLTVFITWINPTDKNNYDEHLLQKQRNVKRKVNSNRRF